LRTVTTGSLTSLERQRTSALLPMVSVVTPSLNQGRYLADAIESVIAQEHPAVEHIVVEGGSTDETNIVLERYAEWPHIRVIKDVPPRGQSAALNVGFRAAKGDIIGWLNADDRYCGGAFAAVVEALANGGPALAYGDCQVIDESGVILKSRATGSFDREKLLKGINQIAQPTVFFHRELFERFGYLDESLHYSMDFDFWLRTSRTTEFRYVERTVAQFRHHAHSKTVRTPYSFYPEMRRVARAHGGPFFTAAFGRRLLQVVLGRRLANHLIWHLTYGADSAAVRHSRGMPPRSPSCPLCRRGLLGGRP
jgi:glycosyltransferase involved in cell wall biosynthesis